MAPNMESSIQRGSDLLFDFSCFTCKENDRNTEAEIYCEDCSKLYCSKCEEHHNYLYKKHTILSKQNISQWPETDVNELEQCQEHMREKLTGFCEDHSQLICHVCHINNHQKCSHVLLIADKVKDLYQKGDLKQLSATVETQLQQLISKKDDFEENMKSLEKSYNKTLEEINALRNTINDSLNQLEKNTKKELDTLRASMRTSIQSDIENCTKSIKSITSLKEDWLKREYKSEAMSFINYRKCLDQSLKVETALTVMATNNERGLKFNSDTIIKHTMSTLSGLGQILSTVKQSQTAENTTQNTGVSKNKPKASTQSNTRNQRTPGFIAKKSNRGFISTGEYRAGTRTSDQGCDPVSSSSHQLVPRYQLNAVIKPVPIMKVTSSMKYRVRIKSDSSLFESNITGICETAAGELILKLTA
ncbi:uncharacterized protein LOC127838542 [Dreissena polymorpha]|uniref:uncharacterized protein LOC127838542 n=1 Tax=Dreissena polymorpha TaxID=45954 RepID=UPI002263D601|nr:uncharacterized protein LOC127838542 [Dreissena polymorpha]